MTTDSHDSGSARATLEEKTLDWIRHQGYPLEFATARAFRQAGWYTGHGVHYQDVSTGKSRPIDVLASVMGSDLSTGQTARVVLAIECKHARQPWVAYRAADAARIVVPVEFFPHGVGQHAYVEATRLVTEAARRLASPSNFAHAGIVQAKLKRVAGKGRPIDLDAPSSANARDYAHEAISEVSSAALGLTQFSSEQVRLTSLFTLDLVMPLVVVQGDLFEYVAAADGSDSLERIRHCVVQVPNPLYTWESLAVTVVDSSVIKEMAQSLAEPAQTVAGALQPHLGRLQEEYRSRVGYSPPAKLEVW